MSRQCTSVTVLAVRPWSTGYKTFIFFFTDIEAMLLWQVFQASPIFVSVALCEQGCTYTAVLTQAFN